MSISFLSRLVSSFKFRLRDALRCLAGGVALGLVGTANVHADLLPAGDYQFSVPLAPLYVDGTFSATIGTQPAVLTLHTDVLGAITGQMTFNGATYNVTGSFASPDGVAVTVKIKAIGATDKYKFKTTLQNAGQPTAALVGTSRTGPAGGSFAPDTAPFSLDVSGASPLALGFNFSLNPPNANGVVRGPGTVSVNGTQVAVIKAKVKLDPATGNGVLSIKNRDLLVSWSGTGSIDTNSALTANWTATAFGTSGQGTNVRVSQLQTDPGGEIKTNSVTALPALTVNPPIPTGGTSATLRFNVPGATSLTLTASGPGSGNLTTYQQNGDLLTVTDLVGDSGTCTLSGVAQTAAGARTFTSSFTVNPTKPILPNVKVDNGVFILGAPPAKTGSAQDPDIASASAPALINGGVSQLTATLSTPALVSRLRFMLVQLQGAGGGTGYFQAPVVVQGSTASVNLRLDASATPAGGTAAANRARILAAAKEEARAPRTRSVSYEPKAKRARNPLLPQPRDSMGGLLQVTIAFVDVDGNVGSSSVVMIDTREVGTGSVQVSLSWDTPTDLDLHVVDPSGAEVYYGNRSVASGGMLDLDSNAGCSIDGINNENVSWSTNAPFGDYIVRVDFYASCDDPSNGVFNGANYNVSVTVDGVVQTFQGSFATSSSDGGSAGSGVQVAKFTRTPKSRVRGTAMYEDFAPTNTGLSDTSTMLPIRLAQVDVYRASDNTVLATGKVSQDGKFDIAFQNDGAPGYFVRVSAQQNDDQLKQKVVDNASTIYFKDSDGAVIDETVEPDKTDVQINAMRADNTGPAFNIFDLGVKGDLTVFSLTGQYMPMLTWLWTSGDPGTCNGAVSCYNKNTDIISVLSTAADTDEYDDTVLLHEYGHFFQYKFSKVNSPGGQHSLASRVVPTLAWGEGSASFFGCYAAGSPLYLDTTPAGIGVRFSVETQDLTVPVGTSTGDQSGNLSEEVVSAVLWDLSDPANEPGDTISDSSGVFKAIIGLKTATSDRGVTGVDLVDFLDNYYRNNPTLSGDATTGIQGNLILNGFPYDFSPPATP